MSLLQQCYALTCYTVTNESLTSTRYRNCDWKDNVKIPLGRTYWPKYSLPENTFMAVYIGAYKCWSLDPLPTWIIKKLKHVFAPILCSLCNFTLSNGVMPASQMHAIVLPRLKKPCLDPTNLSSYRPISNLSFLSKLVERVATVRFISHAEENKLFPDRQSSYRRGHSTETAVLCVHNDLVHVIDEQRITGLVMLDLSAAFDTVDHSILLSVLERRFGVCDTTLSWFTSYLSGRTQTFHVARCCVGGDVKPCSINQSTMSMAPHPINYQSAVPFHKAPQPDRLSLSPRGLHGRCVLGVQPSQSPAPSVC